MNVYQVLTPAGGFNAVYDNEESPVEYQGDDLAISFFKNWVEINQVSGEHGHLLDSNNIQPFELYGFCQPKDSGIIVIPPFDELMDIGIENKFSEQSNEEKEPKEMEQSSIVLDAVSGSEKLKLVRELGSIRTSISSVISGMEKLKLVKRVKEIRELLGVKSADTNFTAIETPQFQIGDYVFAIKDIDFYGRDEMRINHIKTDYDSNKQMLKLEDKGSQYWNASDFKLSRRSGDVRDREQQPEEAKNTIEDLNAVMPLLKQFIGKSQLSAVGMGIRGEEKQFFIDKMLEIANTIKTMPKTYGQDGMGDKAVAYLHYFKGSADWYITEKDMEDEQLQAFGLADLFGDGGELGYISIEELIGSGVELDFYWKPKTIGEIRGGGNEQSDKRIHPNHPGDDVLEFSNARDVRRWIEHVGDIQKSSYSSLTYIFSKNGDEYIHSNRSEWENQGDEFIPLIYTKVNHSNQSAKSSSVDTEEINSIAEKFFTEIGNIADESRLYNTSFQTSTGDGFAISLEARKGSDAGKVFKLSLSDIHNGNTLYVNMTEHLSKFEDVVKGRVINSHELKFDGSVNGLTSAINSIRGKVLDWLGIKSAGVNETEPDRLFLRSVINGTADMDAETFPDQIEKVAEALGDGDVLVIQAANAYADYITKKSKELLG